MESKLWVIRGPGMPSKIVRSDKPLTEAKVKEFYLASFKFRTSELVRDPDYPYPLCKPVDDAEIQKNYSWMMRESLRKNHRALIEIKNGVVVDQTKPPKAAKKTPTKVS